MRRLPLLAALIACRTAEPSLQYELSVVEGTGTRLPSRAGDPMTVEVELSRTLDGDRIPLCGEDGVDDSPYGCVDFDATPVVMGAEALPVAVEPLVDVAGTRFAWTIDVPPGTYRIVGAAEAPGVPVRPPVAFQLLDWGAATPFDKASVAGLWSLTEYRTMPQDFDAGSFHPPIAVELSAVDAQGADVRIVVRHPAQDCVAMRMRAAWDGTELAWAAESLTLEHDELGTLTAEELGISIAWRSGEDDADVRAHARLDTAPYGPVIDGSNADPQPSDACDLLAAVGGVCAPCDFADSDYCVGIRGYAGHLERLEQTLAADLPLCGLTFDDVAVPDLGEWSCEYEPPDCSCATTGFRASWLGAVVLMAALRRRSVSAIRTGTRRGGLRGWSRAARG